MDLNSRSAKILNLLLEQSAAISAEEIGKQLKLTPRAVRYRIPQIRVILRDFDISLINKPGVGIKVEAPDSIKNKIQNKLCVSTYYTRPEREYIILFSLLSAKEPVTINQMEYLLTISRTTISKDIANLKAWMNDHGLVIRSKPNFGFWVEGDESEIREAILVCILTGSKAFQFQDELMCFCFADEKINLPNNEFSRLILTYFSLVDCVFINQLLNMIIDIHLSDRAQFQFILRLAILIRRLTLGKTISNLAAGLGDFKQLNEFYWSEFIFRKIAEKYFLQGGLMEISWITKFLLDAQATRPVKRGDGHTNQKTVFNEEIIKMVDAFLCRVSRRLNPSLAIDKELRDNLSLHLSFFKERENIQRLDENPIIQEIKNEYPRIFSIVSDSTNKEEDSLFILNEDELAYLTIHIAAAIERLRYNENSKKTVLIVCNAGIASALLLKSKIQNEFPDVKIEDVISYNELLKRTDFSGIDLIISTIPLHLVNAPPVLEVNVILRDHDISNLQKVLLVKKSNSARFPKASISEGPRLAALIDNNLISIKEEANNWEEATEKAGKLLLKSHLIETGYIESMKNVVKEFGPFVVAWPGVALLHAGCDQGAKQPGISMITLKWPVNFGHPENDPVDVVIGLSIPAGCSLALALDQLNNLLTDSNATRMIRTSYRRSTIMMLVKKFCREITLQPS